MASSMIKNIGVLVNVRDKSQLLRGKDLAELPVIHNAWLLLEGAHIAAYGTMEQLPTGMDSGAIIDAKGAAVLPCWCDSHTHLVFANTRETEFVDKLKGLSYAEIAARGGGILNSATSVNEASRRSIIQYGMEAIGGIDEIGHRCY